MCIQNGVKIMSNIIYEIFDARDIIPDVILDIGSFDCKDSIIFSKKWPSAKIYAFEPSIEALEVARENIKNYNNIELIDCAVSNIDGYISWYQSSGESIGSSSIKKPVGHLLNHPNIIFNKRENIQSIKLDTWVKAKDIDIIDLIWCDVNGAEDMFLKGANETLKHTRLLWTEYFEFELYEHQLPLFEIQKILIDFDLVKIIGNNALFMNNNKTSIWTSTQRRK